MTFFTCTEIDNNIISIESNSGIAGLEFNVKGNIVIEEFFLTGDWNIASGNGKILIYNLKQFSNISAITALFFLFSLS